MALQWGRDQVIAEMRRWFRIEALNTGFNGAAIR